MPTVPSSPVEVQLKMADDCVILAALKLFIAEGVVVSVSANAIADTNKTTTILVAI